jgi:hypothetical protein
MFASNEIGLSLFYVGSRPTLDKQIIFPTLPVAKNSFVANLLKSILIIFKY